MRGTQQKAVIVSDIATGKPISDSKMRSLARAVVLVLSFLAALYALDWLSMPSFSPPGPVTMQSSPSLAGPIVTQASTTADLPKLSMPGFSWYALSGLNVHTIEGTAAVSGTAIIHFTAVPTGGRHSVAVQITGLEKGRTYRIAIWLKTKDRANSEIEAGDHAAINSSYGIGLFNLNAFRSGGTPAAKPGMAPGPAGWTKVWVDLPTANGMLFFALYVLKGGENTFMGDGKLGLTLGGMALEPQG